MIEPPINSARGFTLVEMLIAVSIALIIFGVGFATITGTMRARAETAARIHSTENARLFFQAVEKDFTPAYPINVSTGIEDLVETGIFEFKRSGTVLVSFESSIFEFCTRADTQNDFSEPLAVRYFVNKKQQIVRMAIPRSTMTALTATSPEMQSEDNAMFDRVHSLHVTFHKWLPNTKTFDPELSLSTSLPVGSVKEATHVRIRLFMFDTLSEIERVDGGEIIDGGFLVKNNEDPNNPNKKTAAHLAPPGAASLRVFTRVIPIPNAFTPVP